MAAGATPYYSPMAATDSPANPTGAGLCVADFLRIDEVQVGRPKIVAGREHLHLPVRWVHIAEIPGISTLLRGGELLLTTGIALPSDDEDLATYVEELAAAGISGLALELVQRYTEPPKVLVEAAERWGIPLIAFEREVPFVAITEAVHGHILNYQLSELRVEERVHRAFQTLGVGASPDAVVAKMSHLVQCPVIFESLRHRPLAVAPHSTSLEDLLAGWEARSRRLDDDHPGWFAGTVVARGQPCGRVVMLLDEPPGTLQRAVIETGSTLLGFAWLVAGPPSSLERAAHLQLLDDIVHTRCQSMNEVYVRARSLGVELRPHDLAVMALRSDHPFCSEELVIGALERAGVGGLVGQVHEGNILVLMGIHPPSSAEHQLASIAEEVRNGYAGAAESLAIGAAYVAKDCDLRRLSAALAEADETAQSMLGSGEQRVMTADDIGLRGLLRLIADEPRVQRFVSTQLRRLWDYDAARGTHLLDILTMYLECGGNKSTAAARSHVSRAAFYHSLDRLAEVLQADLEQPEVRTALHVAVLASAVGPPGS